MPDSQADDSSFDSARNKTSFSTIGEQQWNLDQDCHGIACGDFRASWHFLQQQRLRGPA